MRQQIVKYLASVFFLLLPIGIGVYKYFDGISGTCLRRFERLQGLLQFVVVSYQRFYVYSTTGHHFQRGGIAERKEFVQEFELQGHNFLFLLVNVSKHSSNVNFTN